MKKSKIKSIRTAKRRGWYLVEMGINDRVKHNVGHVGLMIWSDRNLQGRYVANYQDGYLSRFAFELIEDAAFFKLRWS